MAYAGQWKGKAEIFAKRREKKIDNYSKKFPHLTRSAHFKHINEQWKQACSINFLTFSNVHYINYRNNLRYVQQCSGLNVVEFTSNFNLNTNSLTKKANELIKTPQIRMHTFIKAYSAMQVWLHTIEFCDMFLVDFREVYPFLMDNLQSNRLKLGKGNRKVYTYKQQKQA